VILKQFKSPVRHFKLGFISFASTDYQRACAAESEVLKVDLRKKANSNLRIIADLPICCLCMLKNHHSILKACTTTTDINCTRAICSSHSVSKAHIMPTRTMRTTTSVQQLTEFISTSKHSHLSPPTLTEQYSCTVS